MSNKLPQILIGIVAVLLVIGAYFFFAFREPEATPQPSVPAFEQIPGRTGAPAGGPAGGGFAEPPSAPPSASGRRQSGAGSLEISMVSGNFYFEPRRLSLQKDQPVKITFRNDGNHTFTAGGLGINEPLRESIEVIEFTPRRAGIFEFLCTVPGHREAGMVGVIEVF